MSESRYAISVVLSVVVLTGSTVVHAQDGTCGTSCENLAGPLAAETGLGPEPYQNFSVTLAGCHCSASSGSSRPVGKVHLPLLLLCERWFRDNVPL